jgi:hypothetical protein
MSSATYYRTEATRCRDLARTSPDPRVAARWRQLAAEYDLLADSMDGVAPSFHHSGAQQQATQQQQSKLEPKDE